jgi:phosphoribosyl-AMP cyclohydrolase / phosphoribosyl-ATP pyrophosphohydrolase
MFCVFCAFLRLKIFSLIIGQYAMAEEKLIVEAEIKIEQPVPQVELVSGVPAMDLGIVLQDLYDLIKARQEQLPEGSYTTYLFNQGLDKILKKVGEESAETIIAAKNATTEETRKLLAGEISDLLYHLLVLMVERKVGLADIQAELNHRAGKPALPKYSK